jgi:hypothetical protein
VPLGTQMIQASFVFNRHDKLWCIRTEVFWSLGEWSVLLSAAQSKEELSGLQLWRQKQISLGRKGNLDVGNKKVKLSLCLSN